MESCVVRLGEDRNAISKFRRAVTIKNNINLEEGIIRCRASYYMEVVSIRDLRDFQ